MPNAETDIVLRMFLIILLIMMSVFLAISEISLASARKMKLQIMKEKGDKNAEKVLDLRMFLIILLIMMSVFLAISEISLASARKMKLQIMKEKGDKNAEKVLEVQETSGNFFAAVQVGTNAIAILGGIVGENILNPFLKPLVISWFSVSPQRADTIGSLISFIFVTSLFIEFADLIPRRLAMAAPEKAAVAVIKPMLFLIFILRPFIVFFDSIASFIEFADLIPRRLAMAAPEKAAVAVIKPMLFLIFILRPFIVFFDSIASFIFKIFKIEQNRNNEITYDDIFAIVDEGAETGVIQKKEHSLIENVFELDTRWVSSIMTYRNDIVYFTVDEDVDEGAETGVIQKKEHSLIENVFELDTRWVSSIMTYRNDIVYFTVDEDEESIKEKISTYPHSKFLICKDDIDSVIGYVDSKNIEESIKEKISTYPHSKFLICKDDIDSVIGYVDSKNILPRILNSEVKSLNNIKDITNTNLLILPNTLTISEALDKFNEAREDFAVILNEYGHVVGLVTFYDVVNTIMGDVVYQDQDEQQIIARGEGSWLIDGVTSVEDVKKVLDIEKFPEEDTYETIAGFMMYMLMAY